MEGYLIKSSVLLLSLYPLFEYIRRKNAYSSNRFIGLAFVLFACILPLVNFSVGSSIEQTVIANTIHQSFQTVEKATTDTSASTINILLIIYLAGLGIFSMRTVSGIFTLIRMYLISSVSWQQEFKVVSLNREISPFSIFNLLYTGNHSLTNDERDMLITHEAVHRDQFHTLDLILLELLTIIFWFNPASWLFQKAIRSEHEYIADSKVLNKGVDPNEYQRFLFSLRTGLQFNSVNNLSSHTSLSKRYKKMKNSAIHQKTNFLRLLSIIPMMGLLMAFSSFLTIGDPDSLPVYKEGEKKMYRVIADNLAYPAEARLNKKTGTVYVSFVVNEEGNVGNIKLGKGNSLLEEVVVVGFVPEDDQGLSSSSGVKTIEDMSIEAVKRLGKFIPAYKDGNAVQVELTLPIKFKLEIK